MSLFDLGIGVGDQHGLRSKSEQRSGPRGKLSGERNVDGTGNVVGCKLIVRTNVDYICTFVEHCFQLDWRQRGQRWTIRQRLGTGAIDLGVLEKITWPRGKIGGQLFDELFPASDLERIVCQTFS